MTSRLRDVKFFRPGLIPRHLLLPISEGRTRSNRHLPASAGYLSRLPQPQPSPSAFACYSEAVQPCPAATRTHRHPRHPASPAAMRTASSFILIDPASHADARAASSSSSRSCPPPPKGLGAARGGTAVRRGDRRERLHHPQPDPTRGSDTVGLRVTERRFGGERRRRSGRARPHPGGGPRRVRKRLPRRPAGASSPSPQRDKFSLMEAAQRQRRYQTAGEPSRTKTALRRRHHPSPPRPAPAASSLPAASCAGGLILPRCAQRQRPHPA